MTVTMLEEHIDLMPGGIIDFAIILHLKSPHHLRNPVQDRILLDASETVIVAM